MKPKNNQIIAIEAPITITAGQAEGDSKGIPSFDVVAYTGGALMLGNFDAPVVVDLDGISFGKSLIANLDHERSQRVGHVTGKTIADGQLVLSGKVSAATEAAREVTGSAANGFVWQASIEAQPDELIEVATGKTTEVNGREFTGPLYVASKSTLKGFAFVSHGADDNTTVSIAASAASQRKEKTMRPEVSKWLKAMLPSVDIDALSAEEVANIEADYDGRGGRRVTKPATPDDPFAARKLEAQRRREILDIADQKCKEYVRAGRADQIDEIQTLSEHAIEAGMTVKDFKISLYESDLPMAHGVPQSKEDRRLTKAVLEAAICQSGGLANIEAHYSKDVLEVAHEEFKSRLGLTELLWIGAKANGYQGRTTGQFNVDAQRAAFRTPQDNRIEASGFSTLSISNVLSNVANKFLRQGWMAIDNDAMFAISAIRNVRDFKQITTVSLTGHLMFESLGASGEIKHGTVSDMTYTNQADTYAKMLAITRKDIINDDLGALTQTPMRLGRGGALKLADIFWTVFLNNSTFFVSTNSNHNEAVADATLGGLAATEAMFRKQTDPDGKPLGIRPRIILTPVEIAATMAALLDPQSTIVSGATGGQSSVNVFRGRFAHYSTVYLSDSNYTGYSAAAWYMLADPNDLPVIEIAALNGNVMPTVEQADADFNVLGIQMRGYSDVGVALQEFRGGVRADGGSS